MVSSAIHDVTPARYNVLVAVLLTACSRPATEIVVSVETNIGEATSDPPPRLTGVFINVNSNGAQTYAQMLPTATQPLPQTLGLVPSDGAAVQHPVTIEAVGFIASGGVVTQRAIASYTQGSIVLLRMSLARSCLNVDCADPSLTCIDGQCRTVLTQSNLPTYDGGVIPPADVFQGVDASDIVPAADADAAIDAFDAFDALGDVPTSDVIAMPDVTDAIDVQPDAGPVLPPRMLSPMSTSRISSPHPVLRWSLENGQDGAQVQLCRTRACTDPTAVTMPAIGSSVGFGELIAGLYFWRLVGTRSGTVGTVLSPTWEFLAAQRPRGIDDTQQGSFLDVDGDGRGDVVVGVPSAAGSGVAYVFTALGPAMNTVMLPNPSGGVLHEFGVGVANAGDVNGDGFGDIVITTTSDTSYLYLGGASGISTTSIALVNAAVVAGVGRQAAGIGDFDGDGYGDIVVGSYGRNTLFAYWGGPDASALSQSQMSMSGTQGFGDAITAAGDFNGDGHPDFVVGAPMTPVVGTSTGYAVMYFGGNGRGVPPFIAFESPPGATTNQFSSVVSGAGDVDGDGYSDVVFGVGAGPGAYIAYGRLAADLNPPPVQPIVNPSPSDSGIDRFGSALAGIGDANGDGFDDVVVGSSNAQTVTIFYGSTAGLAMPRVDPYGALSFGSSVAGAGDVDGDGYADWIVGAPRGNAAFIMHGSSGTAGYPPRDMLSMGPSGFGQTVARLDRAPWRRALGLL